MPRSRQDRALDEVMKEEREHEIREEAIEWADEQVQRGTYPDLSHEMMRAIYVMVHPLTGNSIIRWAEIAGIDRKTWPRNRSRTAWVQAVETLRQERRGRQLALADRVIEELTGADVDPKVRLAAARTIYEREGQFIKRVETSTKAATPAERAAQARMRNRLGARQQPSTDSPTSH